MKLIKDIKKPSQIKALLALTKADFLSNIRNLTSTFFNFFFPIIFIVIFGLMNAGDAFFSVGITENSVKEGPLYEMIQKVSVLKLINDKSDAEFTDDLKKGRISVVLDIQKRETEVSPGVKIPQYLVHIERSAASPESAETIVNILESITNKINTPPDIAKNQLVKTDIEVVEGRKLKQIDYVLPGMLAFALLSNALFGISFALVSMKKELIIKRIFATPVRKTSILLSQLLSKLVISILQAITIILFGYFVFHFSLAHGAITLFYLIVLSLIGTLVFLSIGLLVAAISKSEESVSPLANLLMMPQLFFAGTFFPIETFPKWLQPIAHFMPMTYLNEAFKKVAFEGSSFSSTFPEIGALILWGILLYALVLFLFKWE